MFCKRGFFTEMSQAINRFVYPFEGRIS